MSSARSVAVLPGELVWCGEHWINYLREAGREANSGMVSLFHTRYSTAGEGNVAFVSLPGPQGFDGVCTDNAGLAEFALATFVRGRGSPFDRDLPIVGAEFAREGDVRTAPAWRVELVDRHSTLRATWRKLQPPVIAEGSFRPGTEHFTILNFAEAATIEFNGRRIPGEPYPVTIWQASIGGDRSSCVFALAETLLRIDGS